mmetsp:Transcript_27559/g.61983  ORF Transcript_27559/g.61983 Transcript_27559/m.61983 type:complete len:81 (+) Transcript_27559:292-534(+)
MKPVAGSAGMLCWTRVGVHHRCCIGLLGTVECPFGCDWSRRTAYDEEGPAWLLYIEQTELQSLLIGVGLVVCFSEALFRE